MTGDMSAAKVAVSKKEPSARTEQRGARLPVKDAKLEELLKLTAAFCKAHLDEEYESLCAKLVRKAGRKRPPPFASGYIESWAAGAVHAICTVNFGFDKSQTPHLSPSRISDHFGVSLNTSSQKSKALREMFRLSYWDPEFSTAALLKRNPMRLVRLW